MSACWPCCLPGRWSSEGDFEFLRNEADDGFDTLQWVAAQPWCGDRIGTLGISYTTATQQALAVRNPPKLATQVLFDGPYNYHSQTMRHGGACEYAIAFQYVVSMARTGKQALADPAALRPLCETAAEFVRGRYDRDATGPALAEWLNAVADGGG